MPPLPPRQPSLERPTSLLAFDAFVAAREAQDPERVLASSCRDILALGPREVAETYPGVAADARDLARALARVVPEIAEREARAGGSPTLPGVLGLVIPRDLGLAEMAMRGSSPAWGHMSLLVQRAVTAIARRIGEGRRGRTLIEEVREDLVGAVFLKNKLATYRSVAPLVPWLRQIAFNRVRERMVELRRDESFSRDWSSLSDEDEGLESGFAASASQDPRTVVESEELRAALQAAFPRVMDSFSADEQRLLRELSSRQSTQVGICQEFGMSPFTLNRWYKEIRGKFQLRLVRELRDLLGLVDATAAEILGLVGLEPET